MSFAGEMDDFLKALEVGSRIKYNKAQRQKIESTTVPRFDPNKNARDPIIGGGVGGGSGVGTTTAPKDQPAQQTDPQTTSSISMPNAGGRSITQQSYAYFRQRGLSHNAAAGIAANIGGESGNDPRVIAGVRKGDAGKSYFAGQWNEQRLANLRAYAGTKTPTFQQQLDFILEEMNPKSRFVDTQAAAMFPQLQQAKTPEEAVGLFAQHFERPKDLSDMKYRLPYLKEIGADTGGGGGTFSFDQTSDGALPAEPAVAPAPPQDTSAQAAPSPDDQSGDLAQNPDITIPDMPEQAALEAPQVNTEFSNPFLYPPGYAKGGAIPDDGVQYFQGAGTVDSYNPYRATTQPVPQTAPAATARRISISDPVTPDWRSWGDSSSPSQVKAQKARADLEAQQKAEADAKAKAAADAAAAKAAADAAARNRQAGSSSRDRPFGSYTMDDGRLGYNYRGGAKRRSEGGGYSTSGGSGGGPGGAYGGQGSGGFAGSGKGWGGTGSIGGFG